MAALASVIADFEGFNDGVCGKFSVTYEKGPVIAGEVNVPKATCVAPRIAYTNDDNEGKKYTLIKADLDAPDRAGHAYREFIHWVVTDITAESLAAGGGLGGKTALDYLGVGAPCNSGLHRYVFLLFEQPEGCDPAASLRTSFEGRGGKKSCIAGATAGLGAVVGITWYESEWDESIDAVHEAMGWLPPEGFRSPKQLAANP